MPTRIDHVIAAAPDLDQLEATFTRLGFHVVGGGQHPHLGTRNRIILLGEGYIELLGVADEHVVSPAVRERITRAPGWIGFVRGRFPTEGDEVRCPGARLAPACRGRPWNLPYA